MHKRILLLTLFASVLLATSVVHAQTNILLGNNLSGFADSIQFTGNGAGANVAFLGTCGANACTQGSAGVGFSNPGTFEMDVVNPLVITNTLGSNGFIMSSGSVTFTFSLANGDPMGAGSLTGTINFTSFADGTSTPSFRGSITVTSVTGSLQTLFTVGTADGVVFTVSNTGGGSVDSIFNSTTAQLTASPYSGNVPAPAAPPPVPEPASIIMLGSGLLALGGTIKRRYFK